MLITKPEDVSSVVGKYVELLITSYGTTGHASQAIQRQHFRQELDRHLPEQWRYMLNQLQRHIGQLCETRSFQYIMNDRFVTKMRAELVAKIQGHMMKVAGHKRPDDTGMEPKPVQSQKTQFAR